MRKEEEEEEQQEVKLNIKPLRSLRLCGENYNRGVAKFAKLKVKRYNNFLRPLCFALKKYKRRVAKFAKLKVKRYNNLQTSSTPSR